MEISGPRIGLRAMQLETVLAHVSQQLITCGRVRKHLTVRPEVGAVCEKDACPDLCGGREVTCVPTATAWHNSSTYIALPWRPQPVADGRKRPDGPPYGRGGPSPWTC